MIIPLAIRSLKNLTNRQLAGAFAVEVAAITGVGLFNAYSIRRNGVTQQANIDAKVEEMNARYDTLSAKVDTSIAALCKIMDKKFEEFSTSMEKLSTRMDVSLKSMEDKIDKMDNKIDRMATNTREEMFRLEQRMVFYGQLKKADQQTNQDRNVITSEVSTER